MADNVEITAGSGTPISTDEIDGKHYQRIKLTDGAADSTAAIGGDATNGLDVDITRIAAGDNNIGNVDIVTLPALAAGTALIGKVSIDQVTANANEVVVKSGTVTAVTAITNVVHVDDNSSTVSVDDGGGALTVDGTVAVTNASLTTIAGAVTGTEMQVDVVTLPAPLNVSGGGTEATALRVTLASDSTGVLSVDDNGGALTVDGTVAVTNASLTTIAGAVAGAEMQVDVLTMPTVTVNAHAVTNAGTFATQVDGAALTALQLIDNMISGSEAQVDIVAALPAGTNAIGKLAANSGVDIGDVDILSIAAGENHLGEIGKKQTHTAITFSLDTNIYADGDVLADTQVLTACLRVNDGTGVILDVIFNDKDDQGIAFDVLILNANTSLGTENSAPNISDANADTIVGRFSVTTVDWYDLGGCRIASISNIGIGIKGAAGTNNIYIALISRGAGTYSASGITATFKILCG